MYILEMNINMNLVKDKRVILVNNLISVAAAYLLLFCDILFSKFNLQTAHFTLKSKFKAIVFLFMTLKLVKHHLQMHTAHRK